MAGDDEVQEQLRRYEIVEWCYDGLNGKIIPWTTEHGNTSHDPSVQAFVLKADGTVLARAPNAQVYQAPSFARWIDEQADDSEKKYPATRVPFVRAEVVAGEDGIEPGQHLVGLDVITNVDQDRGHETVGQRRNHRHAARRRRATEDQPLGHRGHLGLADHDWGRAGLRPAFDGCEPGQESSDSGYMECPINSSGPQLSRQKLDIITH